MALNGLSARITEFHNRPFPTEWAKVVRGVGLASLSMRAERSLRGLGRLAPMCSFRLPYLLSLNEPAATTKKLRGELHPLLEKFDRFLPALPAAVVPAAWLARRHRGQRRKQLGLCPDCGYDLRATPGRCPECGVLPSTIAA